MQEQNLKNHSRLVPLYHFVGSLAILIPFVFSVINLCKAIRDESGRLNATLIVLFIFGVGLLYYFVRSFALKAQDKAIHAEVSLRYYAISGNLPDTKLTMGQMIALRFAHNNELVELAHRAVAENLKPVEIKKAIQNWKADHYRV